MIVLAPLRWLSLGQRLCDAFVDVCDVALEALHVHVRLSAAFRDPQPGTCAAARRTRLEGSRNLIISSGMPWSMRQDAEDDQILHSNLRQIRFVSNSKSCALGHALVLCMHPASAGQALRTIPVAVPVIWMIAAVRPLGDETAAVTKARKCLIVRVLDSEAAAGGKLKEFVLRGWMSVAASTVLEPPV